jgi:hypothetical protein
MNPEALLELASVPRLIPHLLERAHKAAQGDVELEAVSAFLPAFARCREVLSDESHFLAATSGDAVKLDRLDLLSRVDEAERALVLALRVNRDQ